MNWISVHLPLHHKLVALDTEQGTCNAGHQTMNNCAILLPQVWYIRNHCPGFSYILELIREFIHTRFYRCTSTSHLLLCNRTKKSALCWFDCQSLPKHFSFCGTDFPSESHNYSLIGFARVSVLSLCWKLCLHWQINTSGTGGEKWMTLTYWTTHL